MIRWFLCLCLLLTACGQAPVLAGGSAVEGETVTARLVDAQGAVLGLVAVQAQDEAGTWSFTGSTDSFGNVSLLVPSRVRDLVLTIESSLGQKLVFRLHLRPSLDTTLILRWSGFGGAVVVPAGWTGHEVRLAHLELVSPLVQGHFQFDHVRVGSWPFELLADSAGVAKTFDLGAVAMGAGGLAGTFGVRPPLWQLNFDSAVSGQCRSRLNSGAATACLQAVVGTAAWRGSSLRLTLADSLASAVIALPQKLSGRVLASDSLVFWARGTGSVRLGWGSDSAGSGESPLVVLQPSWTRIALLVGANLQIDWIAVRAQEQVWMVWDQVELRSAEPAGSVVKAESE